MDCSGQDSFWTGKRHAYVGFFYIPPVTSCNAIQARLQWQTLEFEIQQYG